MPSRSLITPVGLVAASLSLLAACSTSVTLGQGEPRRYPDGAIRVRCGAIDCEPGKICCNASCGVCAAVGGCPPVPLTCTDAAAPCGPDLVSLNGSAACSSFVWNGVDCVEAVGCACVGACTLPQPTYGACMDLHAACWASACATSADCPRTYFCEHDGCDLSASGTCAHAPTDCTSEPSGAVCGCDHIAYRSACDAARANESLETGPPRCGACNPAAIDITPGCGTFLGWEWDGVCFERLGCACTGECDRLEPTQAACNARYASACRGLFPCGPTSCLRSAEVCDTTMMGGLCASPPPTCASPTCACLIAAGRATMATCSDDGAGAVTITGG